MSEDELQRDSKKQSETIRRRFSTSSGSVQSSSSPVPRDGAAVVVSDRVRISVRILVKQQPWWASAGGLDRYLTNQ
jgi:hypothetical protein